MAEPTGSSWGHLLAVARGVPAVEVPATDATLGSIAELTAGFRDQYYGLVDAVIDAEPEIEPPRLLLPMPL